jgi:hypothetical protein
MNKVKLLFFLLGAGAYLVAGALLMARAKSNPFSVTPKWWLANKEYDKVVATASFSPDGRKLFIEVRNESGELSEVDPYLYELNEKVLRPCTIERYCGSAYWAPDSRHLAFNQFAPHMRYLREGCVYDIERNIITEHFSIMLGGGWRQHWSPDGEWLLFLHPVTRKRYAKQMGEPVWIELPEGIPLPFWSNDGTTMIGYKPEERALYKFDFVKQSSRILALFDEHKIRPVFYRSPYANEAFVLAYGKPGDRFCTVVQKISIDTGQITSFDTGLDPGTASLIGVFVPREENLLYFNTYQGTVDAKPVGEPPKLVLLNTRTGEMETVLSGRYRFYDYCGIRDMFAITLPEDGHKKLYLFDVKTKRFEQIFPSTG